MINFNQFGDARIGRDQYETLIQNASLEIAEMIKYEITSVVYNATAYTIAGASAESKYLASDLISQIKEKVENIKWEDAISEYHQQEIDQVEADDIYRSIHIPCHKCHALYPRNEFTSIILSRPDPPDTPESLKEMVDHCYGLCTKCIQEYTYQFNGLHFTCSYCNKRYGYGNSIQGKPYSNELCGECQDDPIIKREEARVKSHVSHSNRIGLPATLTLKQWFATLDYFKNLCAYCSEPFNVIEHYIPVALLGGTTQANCLPSCEKCNGRKNNRHPDNFRRLFPEENINRIKAYFSSL